MEKTLSDLLKNYHKGDSAVFLEIATKMEPLIHAYTQKLFFWDPDDARQELLLTLLECVQKIQYISSEGECLRYVKTCIHRKYKDIVKKETRQKTEYMEDYDISDPADIIETVIFHLSLQKLSYQFHGKQKNILNAILYGYSDMEIAEQFQVSRQYVNRIRNLSLNTLKS